MVNRGYFKMLSFLAWKPLSFPIWVAMISHNVKFGTLIDDLLLGHMFS